MSYGHFEQQTLQHRIQEAKQKLHLVRKFVYKSAGCQYQGASESLELDGSQHSVDGLGRYWFDSGVCTHTSWMACHKVRSVLNQPALISRVSTSDLFALPLGPCSAGPETTGARGDPAHTSAMRFKA